MSRAGLKICRCEELKRLSNPTRIWLLERLLRTLKFILSIKFMPLNDLKFKKLLKHQAFTLAEVLITLGIIGVVAALSIPGLINSGKEHEYTNSLKVFNSELSQAMVTMQTPSSEYTIPENYADAVQESTEMRDNLCSVMSCIKKDTVLSVFGAYLGSNDLNNTVYKNYKSTSRVYTDLGSGHAAAVLKNGMFVGVHFNWEARKSFQLYVDTNGKKGPNMFGQDLNMFEIIKNDSGYYKPVVAGGPGTVRTVSAGATCQINQSSYGSVWPCSYYRLYIPDKMP